MPGTACVRQEIRFSRTFNVADRVIDFRDNLFEGSPFVVDVGRRSEEDLHQLIAWA